MNSECEKMSDWLERDPDNGMLIGPDGCHYSNEHQARHYALLHLCGCGSPENAYNFCRDALALFDRRAALSVPSTGEWLDAEEALGALIAKHPDITAHVLAHLFSHLNLLEHGASVGGSWLTRDGERIVDAPPATEEVMDA